MALAGWGNFIYSSDQTIDVLGDAVSGARLTLSLYSDSGVRMFCFVCVWFGIT